MSDRCPRIPPLAASVRYIRMLMCIRTWSETFGMIPLKFSIDPLIY